MLIKNRKFTGFLLLALLSTVITSFTLDREPAAQTPPTLTLSAPAYLVVAVDKDDHEHLLIEKNSNQPRPIASLTKLMTAIVATSLYETADLVTTSSSSVPVAGRSGVYREDNQFSYDTVLHALLIASHNEQAEALAAKTGRDNFVADMNRSARELGLTQTKFYNPSGLDPMEEASEINQSSAMNIYRLLKFTKETKPEMMAIMSQQRYDLVDNRDRLLASLSNTDQLLGDTTLPWPVIVGKTGQTPRAGKNLAIIAQGGQGNLIYAVVLGAEDNFSDMKKLLRYTKDYLY
jgi:D-alanyl-D-alanine carboxypeptidase